MGLQETYEWKKLIIFDLYDTCIYIPKWTISRFHIPRDLVEILETHPIDLDEIEAGYKFEWTKIQLHVTIINQIRESISKVLLYPDFEDTINYLKNKWCKTAVVSNLSKPYEEPLNKLIPGWTFDYKALSFDVWCMKPNTEIFEYIRKESWIDFKDMVMVWDSLKSDVTWAHNVWIIPIHLNRGEEWIKEVYKKWINFIQIPTLAALKEIL